MKIIVTLFPLRGDPPEARLLTIDIVDGTSENLWRVLAQSADEDFLMLGDVFVRKSLIKHVTVVKDA